jgi:hypothetical protein
MNRERNQSRVAENRNSDLRKIATKKRWRERPVCVFCGSERVEVVMMGRDTDWCRCRECGEEF